MSIQDRIALIYYNYGLFCASHSYSIIGSVLFIVIIACYPLTKVPLPGNAPLEYTIPIQNFLEQRQMTSHGKDYSLHGKDLKVPPRWYTGSPFGYIQQILFKGTVKPWFPKKMIPSDAFRGPLSKVFDVVEELNLFKYSNNGTDFSLPDLCLHISEPVTSKSLYQYLPSFSCLILSPANLWNSDSNQFKSDDKFIKTVTQKFGQPLDTPPTIQDILFGVPWKETGVKRFYIRNRQRIISFAVTIIFKSYNQKFHESLRHTLEKTLPGRIHNANNSAINHIVHIYFKDINYFVEYTPLMVTYLVLLLYIYFSVRKIEMVKSKWGLALSAVATVIASLLMSVSICTMFGLTTTLNGGEIFPYLVVIIGLENVLILTKSVVSTPVHLEVKYRVAQGLSKEGWSITKNLTTELLIILVGFFTFVPAIQEFCLFAVVGLLTDFFLQMVFFATVLSVDIRRMELSDLQKQNIHSSISGNEGSSNTYPPRESSFHSPVMFLQDTRSMPKQQKEKQVNVPNNDPSPSFAQMRDEFFNSPTILELPRRLQILFFLARTRIVQRVIMMGTVIWIILILYKAGLIGYSLVDSIIALVYGGLFKNSSSHQNEERLMGKYDDDAGSVEHKDLEMWRKLSYKHFPTLFGYYNISIYGRFVSILPTIHLSAIITPEEAIQSRHPNDIEMLKKQQNAVESGWEEYLPGMKSGDTEGSNSQYFSEREFFITVCLVLLSFILIFYFIITRCSGRFSKWRQTWCKFRQRKQKVVEQTNNYIQQIHESMPLVLKGHSQEIECVKTDGQLIVSACLGGTLMVWDSFTGECLTRILRHNLSVRNEHHMNKNNTDATSAFAEQENSNTDSINRLSSVNTNILSSSFKSERNSQSFLNELPDLSSTIDSDFTSSISSTYSSPFGTPDNSVNNLTGFDFGAHFNEVYKDHISTVKEDRGCQNRRNHLEIDNFDLFTFDDLDSRSSTSTGSCFLGYSLLLSCVYSFFYSLLSPLLQYFNIFFIYCYCLLVFYYRLVASRLDGSMDFLELETFQNLGNISSNSTPGLHTRGPVRHPSSSASNKNSTGTVGCWEESVSCALLQRIQAHQKPITALQSEAGRVVSASDDRTLKVFCLEDCICMYTLYGHHGSITALYLDRGPPFSAASASTDGTVRLWDLLTGFCIHKLCSYEQPITALTCSLQYVISQDQDYHLCVWDRIRGQLLYNLQLEPGLYSQQMALLTDKLLLLGGQGVLYLWDIFQGQLKKQIKVSHTDQAAFIRFVQVIDHSVVCDYGNELRVINFPTILEKND
ncbi:sterol regulatory element-binding protein cleavage-activating protein [Octopus bimaculoides]|nr:sterol regulatory element-binding protein cleavage-activating protein [Octopus bimaculoides]